jgi:hypothetical protein
MPGRLLLLLWLVSYAPSVHAQTSPQVPNLVGESSYTVLVQPIIVRADQGEGPARCRIVESLIDQVYAAADIDFQFVEPIFYDNTQARDGLVDLDTVVQWAERDGIVRSPERQINMFFVNQVDGKPGPLGRGRTPGWQVFVAMAPGGRNPNDAEDAFVVAHEAAHNLGLQHAVDDPQVGEAYPNLMGGGPYEQRLSKSALNRYQINTIRKSPLVRPRIECLSQQEAQRAILDDSYGNYFSRLQRREVATLTGNTVECTELRLCQDEARRRIADAVLPFTQREEESVAWFAERLGELLGDDFALFRKHPWRFIKVRDTLAAGFSHTRATYIIFSQRTVERIVTARNDPNELDALRKMGPLFVHEQMHVFERLFPSRFVPLFENTLGFQQATVESHRWLDERQICNPDALNLNWVVSTRQDPGEQPNLFWLRTLLRDGPEIPQMGRDFLPVAVRLTRDGDRFRVAVDADDKPLTVPISSLTEYVARLPIDNGLDHPNEVAAYLFQHVLMKDYLTAEQKPDAVANNPVYTQFQRWCRINLN